MNDKSSSISGSGSSSDSGGSSSASSSPPIALESPSYSHVVVTQSEGGELAKPVAFQYLVAFKEIIINLPSELGKFGSIPCAQRSLYTGILAGGIVSAISLVLTGRFRAFKHGFFTYVGVSIVAWEYCNYKHRDGQAAIYQHLYTTTVTDQPTTNTTTTLETNKSDHPNLEHPQSCEMKR